jgi:hypothetical protein
VVATFRLIFLPAFWTVAGTVAIATPLVLLSINLPSTAIVLQSFGLGFLNVVVAESRIVASVVFTVERHLVSAIDAPFSFCPPLVARRCCSNSEIRRCTERGGGEEEVEVNVAPATITTSAPMLLESEESFSS